MFSFDFYYVCCVFLCVVSCYDVVVVLQCEVVKCLLELLDYLGECQFQVVLDIGSGIGYVSVMMKKCWFKVQVIVLDLVELMLCEVKKQVGWWKLFVCVCVDVQVLLLQDQSVDLIYSNLCLQWVDDLLVVFVGFCCVFKFGGLLVCFMFGLEILIELCDVFVQVDVVLYVSWFVFIVQFGDVLMMVGFCDLVLDCDLFILIYDDLFVLMCELQVIGVINVCYDCCYILIGWGCFDVVCVVYELLWCEDGKLFSSWEVIYVYVWVFDLGVLICECGYDIVSVLVLVILICCRFI